MYWAGSCGGCEIAVLEIREKILEVDENFDIVFWPVAVDFKYKDVEAYDDGYIDVCLFNGCIRNSEHTHIAKVLRAKSKVLVAFGACATMGGIPGLANVSSAQEIKELVYTQNPSVDNPDRVFPQETYEVPEGELTLPHLYDTVKTLEQTSCRSTTRCRAAPPRRIRSPACSTSSSPASRARARCRPPGRSSASPPRPAATSATASRKRRRSPASSGSGSSCPTRRSACSSRV